MDNAIFEPALAVWDTDTPPRVWSILVTLFGDIAQVRGTYLSGTTVNAILSGINIRPEAIRVALHRLRNDGWIESTKVGRKSHYVLSKWGLEECARANAQIYGPWPISADAYLVATDPNNTATAPLEGAVPIAPTLYICTRPLDAQADRLVVALRKTQTIPPWLQNTLCPTDIKAAAATFQHRLQSFRGLNVPFEDLTPIQTAILRTVIMHEWRRIILRVPAVPDFLLPRGCLDAGSKAFLVETLALLGKPNHADLNAAR